MGSRYVPDHCSVYTQNTTNTPLTKQGATFYMDKQHNRLGMMTTNPIKHAMCQLTVLMLEERRSVMLLLV